MSSPDPYPLTKTILEAAGFTVTGMTAAIKTQVMPSVPGVAVRVKATLGGPAFIEGEITDAGVNALADRHGMSVHEVRAHIAKMMEI